MTRLSSGKCVDVNGVRTAPGTPLIIWPCHGAVNQQFTIPAAGTTGEIRAYNGTMCVDAASGQGNNGDAIIIWPCHGGANQQWTVTSDGLIRGIDSKCIDVPGYNSTDGTELILWSCHGGANQQWDVVAQPALPPAPPPAPPAPDQPAVLVGAGDVGACYSSGDEATASLLDGISGTVFIPGDVAYPSGSSWDFTNCFAPSWGRHTWRTRPAPGNHEYETSGAAGYFDYFGAAAGQRGLGYYSYDVGAWHVVSLNSNVDVSSGSTQLQWLRQDLAANRRTCTVAYWHHPLYSSGGHGNDPRMQALWQVLYDAGVDLVLNGHDHDYERFAPQTPWGQADWSRGIREFVVGTGGASHGGSGSRKANSEFFEGNVYGVLKLELGSGGYAWSFIDTSWTVRDSGSGSCH